MQITKARREPSVDSENLDWAAYHRRLVALRKVAGPDWVPAKVKVPHATLLDPDPKLYVLYNWTPFSREDRERVRADYGSSVFRGTTQCAIYPTEWHEHGTFVDPETGDEDPTFARVVHPRLPDDVEALLTVFVPVADLNKWDIERVMAPVEKLVRGAIAGCPTHEEAPGMLPATGDLVLPSPEGPAVTFHVAVGGMRQEDVGRIMKEFRKQLHLALEDADRLKPVVPPQRRYLLHEREETFQKELEWYRLWMDGLTFRKIALKVGNKSTEDAVGKSVKRTYEAIYLEPFREEQPDGSVKEKARERRARLPLPDYNCREHGTSCPPTCPYRLKWADRAVLDLPKDETGDLPGKVPIERVPVGLLPVGTFVGTPEPRGGSWKRFTTVEPPPPDYRTIGREIWWDLPAEARSLIKEWAYKYDPSCEPTRETVRARTGLSDEVLDVLYDYVRVVLIH